MATPAQAPCPSAMNCPAATCGRTASSPSANQNRKTEEIVNYDISRTTRTEVIEGGRINRVSVAVVVDGTYSRNDKGETTYQPRTKDEIDRIAALVRTTIGFDAKRGDQVEVANLRLAEAPVIPAAEPAGWMGVPQFTKEDIMRGIELGVMALLALLAMLLIVRPMLRRILSGEAPAPAPAVAANPYGYAVATSLPAVAPVPEQVPLPPPPPSRTATMIDIAQVQGQVHAQSVQKVGELADRNPNETASIIRNWLHEHAA